MSSLEGMTLLHHEHQLRHLPSTSRDKYFPCSLSSSNFVTHAPTFTILTSFVLTTPPIPSISCLAYPGPICPFDPDPDPDPEEVPVPGRGELDDVSSPVSPFAPIAAKLEVDVPASLSLSSLKSSASQSTSSST